MSIVYLNGEYLPLEEANINVMDRGFIFADGIYENIPVFNKKILRVAEHLQRMDNSLRNVYMENPLEHQQWEKIFYTLIEKNGHTDQSVYVQVTRGVSVRDHAIDICGKPTVFAMCIPIGQINHAEGIKAITHRDIRWQYCSIKTINLLPAVLIRHRAKLRGAREAILLRDGKVSEGAATNVFLCEKNIVKTPMKTEEVLPGVTRDLILGLLRDDGIECREADITEQELTDADEIWVTSATWGVMPVVQLNDEPVGDGKPGKLWNKANNLYQQYKASN